MKWIRVDEDAFYVDDQNVDLYRDVVYGGWVLDIADTIYRFVSKQHAMRAYEAYIRTGVIIEES